MYTLHLVKSSTATTDPACHGLAASTLMSHWHSVTCLQQTANGKLEASSPLLRFYKASRSPAATSTQRIIQPRNNKRAGEGMSVTAGPASHRAKTQWRERDFGIIWKLPYSWSLWGQQQFGLLCTLQYLQMKIILQVAKSPVQTYKRIGPCRPPPSHPLSSAKPHRDHFMMSRITGKPPIMNLWERATPRPTNPVCVYGCLSTSPQNPKLPANHPLKEQTNSDVKAHYLWAV